MAGFWKIQKEWIQDKHLSWSEAGVLADIIDWPNATVKERAERCGLTKKSVIDIMKRCRNYTEFGIETTPKRCRNYTEFGIETTPKEKEKKEIPPTPPIKNKKENIKEQEERGEHIDAALEGTKQEKKFIPPTIEEIKKYCEERGNNIDAEAFFDFYNAAGWVYGKNKIPVKDWKSCIRTWERKNNKDVTKMTMEIAEGWKRAYLIKFGFEYMGDEKKQIASDFARCSHAIEKIMLLYKESDVVNFCERMFTAMLNVADNFQIDRWSPEYTSKKFDELFRKVMTNGTASAKPTNRHQPKYSAEFLADIAAGLAGGPQDIG